MGEDDGGQTGGAQEDEGGVPAEDGGVGELDEGAGESGSERGVRVCEAVLVEVVDVRDAEVEGGEEDDPAGGQVREEVQGGEEGAEDDFFGDGALAVVNAG